MDKNESRVIQMMGMGFTKAAESFTRMVGKKVSIAHNHPGLIKHEIDYAHLTPKSGDLLVLTTQMIGELTGKSYFILNDNEASDIAKEVYRMPKERLSGEICEAVVLEIDNIISASVIGEVSNVLNKEVYGDVPAIQKIRGQEIASFMKSDFTSNKAASNIVVCSTTFHVEGYNRMQMHFIWKISSKVFELIPKETLAL